MLFQLLGEDSCLSLAAHASALVPIQDWSCSRTETQTYNPQHSADTEDFVLNPHADNYSTFLTDL